MFRFHGQIPFGLGYPAMIKTKVVVGHLACLEATPEAVFAMSIYAIGQL
jgi:hypothetical protein